LVKDVGFGGTSFEFRILGLRLWPWGSGLGVWGLVIWGLWVGAQGWGFGLQGSGFGVWGLGFGILGEGVGIRDLGLQGSRFGVSGHEVLGLEFAARFTARPSV
jgi:hypothetical protein